MDGMYTMDIILEKFSEAYKRISKESIKCSVIIGTSLPNIDHPSVNKANTTDRKKGFGVFVGSFES